MVDRPIIFSGPMIRGLLAGRKTQTRRVARSSAPYAAPARQFEVGDRLWVRETVACGACAPSRPSYWAPSFWRREQGTPRNPSGLWYAADGLEPEKMITERGKWVPSIHMPRWASRLTLIIESVRVERLLDIGEEDSKAEGVQFEPSIAPDAHRYFVELGDGECATGWTAREAFSDLWHVIHGPGSWAANPWVRAIGFRVIHANIDVLPREAA